MQKQMREREASTAHVSDRVHGSEHPDRKEGAADCVFSDRFIFEQPSLWRFFSDRQQFPQFKSDPTDDVAGWFAFVVSSQ